VPVAWFSSINAAVVILIAPGIAALWVRLAARNRQVDIVQKYFFAISMAMLGNALMYVAGLLTVHGAQAPLWIPLVSVALLGFGEIVAWTATYGFVSRAAPAGFASVTMGAWYLLTLGLGGYLSGVTGSDVSFRERRHVAALRGNAREGPWANLNDVHVRVRRDHTARDHHDRRLVRA
jgi:POT family proton-dependent oligopeptide transporter